MNDFDLKKYLAEGKLTEQDTPIDPLSSEEREEMNRLYAIEDDLEDQLGVIYKQVGQNLTQMKKVFKGEHLPMSDKDNFYKPQQ